MKQCSKYLNKNAQVDFWSFIDFEYYLRYLGSCFGSGLMSNDRWVDGMKKMGGNARAPKKSTHRMFVHHKAYMVRPHAPKVP